MGVKPCMAWRDDCDHDASNLRLCHGSSHQGQAATDHVAVAVLDARHNLLEEVAGLILQQPPLLHDVIKQLPCLQYNSCLSRNVICPKVSKGP